MTLASILPPTTVSVLLTVTRLHASSGQGGVRNHSWVEVSQMCISELPATRMQTRFPRAVAEPSFPEIGASVPSLQCIEATVEDFMPLIDSAPTEKGERRKEGGEGEGDGESEGEREGRGRGSQVLHTHTHCTSSIDIIIILHIKKGAHIVFSTHSLCPLSLSLCISASFKRSSCSSRLLLALATETSL